MRSENYFSRGKSTLTLSFHIIETEYIYTMQICLRLA
jgi:hypothetical protein